MQASFAVGVLPRIAQRLVRQGCVLCQPREAVRLVADLTEAAVLPAPADAAFFVGDFQRCAVQVGAEPVNLPVRVVPQMVNRASGLQASLGSQIYVLHCPSWCCSCNRR